MVNFPIKWNFNSEGASYTSPHWQSAGLGSLRTVQIEIGQSESKYPTPIIKVKVVSQNLFQRLINAIAAVWNPAKYALTAYWTSGKVFKTYPLPAPLPVPTSTSSKVDHAIQELPLFERIWNNNLKDIDVNKLDQLQNFTLPATIAIPVPEKPDTSEVKEMSRSTSEQEEFKEPVVEAESTSQGPISEQPFEQVVRTEEVITARQELPVETQASTTNVASSTELEEAIASTEDITDKDTFETGLLQLQKLAQEGNLEAQYQFGSALLRALEKNALYHDIEQDSREQLVILAKTFLEMAAQKNHLQAIELLANLNVA